jgi:hypothetical protein
LEAADAVELVDRAVGGLADLAQGLDLEAVLVGQPGIGIEHGAAAADEVGVEFGVRVLAGRG